MGDLLSRNTCGGWSWGGRGVLPCRSGYPERPRANHYHLAAPSMFTAAPGLNGFHMAPRHLRHNLCEHTEIHFHKADAHTSDTHVHPTADCTSVYTQYQKQKVYLYSTFSINIFKHKKRMHMAHRRVCTHNTGTMHKCSHTHKHGR